MILTIEIDDSNIEGIINVIPFINNPYILNELLDLNDTQVNIELARNKYTSIDTLEYLADKTEYMVCFGLASREDINLFIFEKLVAMSKHLYDSELKRKIIGNRTCPESIIKDFCNDKSITVSSFARRILNECLE